MFDIDKEILGDEMHVNVILKRSKMKREGAKRRASATTTARQGGKNRLIEGGDCCGARVGDGEEISEPTDVTSGNGCGVR